MIRKQDENGNIILEDKEFLYNMCPTTITIPKEEAKLILERFPAPKVPDSITTKPFDEFNPGDYVSDYLVIIDNLEIRPSSSKPFLNFRCINAKGEFYGKKWDSKDEPTQQSFDMLNEQPIVLVSGKVQEFPKGSGKKSFVMDKFLPYTGEIHPMALLPTTQENLENLTLEFFHYLYQIDEPLRSVVLGIFDEYWSEFSLKPAATGYHHNFIGGLLQHTTELLRVDTHLLSVDNLEKELSSMVLTIMKHHLIESMSNRRKEAPVYYNRLAWSGTFDHLTDSIDSLCTSLLTTEINRNHVLFGHALHDIGKVFEYSNLGESNKYSLLFPFASDSDVTPESATSISVDVLGGQLGHMPAGILILQNYLTKNKVDLSREEIVQLMNVILSHHGKADWGSTVRPNSPTAWLVHIVDYIDSRYAQNPNK